MSGEFESLQETLAECVALAKRLGEFGAYKPGELTLKYDPDDAQVASEALSRIADELHAQLAEHELAVFKQMERAVSIARNR